MGIRGLTGFIDKNQELLQQHELHSCSVVVDGNNFYHYLYQACHVQSICGGDYDVYKANVVSTFQSMKACGIKPYVILDGAYTVDGRKLKTSLSRAANRIKLVDSVTNGYQAHVLPVLAYETFVQVMVELRIPYAMCQFEADSEIATLANHLQCPVISNDSDFYIFDLGFGFLPLDYIDFRPVYKQNGESETPHSYLHCHRYHVDNFISSFNLERSNLPIFATLLGNDFIDANNFSNFYAKFKVPKVESKKFSLPPRMTRVISVLHWLHTQADEKSITYLRDQILTYIPPNKTSIVKILFDKAVAGYTGVDTFEGHDLFKFFTDDTFCSFYPSSEFRGYNGKPFPPWFMQAVCKGELTSHILNAAILHRVILLTQMECLASASSCNASSFLRNVLYSILLKDDCCSLTGSSCEEIEKLTSEFQNLNDGREKFSSSCMVSYGSEAISDISEQEANLDNEENTLCDKEKDESDKSDEELIDQDILQDRDQKQNSVLVLKRLPWKENAVEEYTRVSKQLKKNVKDLSSETENLKLPGLEMMNTLELDEKRGIIYQAFNINPLALKYFPDKLKVFCLCVIAWIRSCEPKVTFSQLDSLILTVLVLTTKRELKERKTKQKSQEAMISGSKETSSLNSKNCDLDSSSKFDIDLVCQQCELVHLKSFSANLEKHKTKPTINRAHPLNTSCCHVFAQLQAILVDACHLTRLLEQPLPIPRPAELINGTLLYNLAVDLSSRPNPELFVSMMFSAKDVASPLRDLFKGMRQFFHEEMSLASLLAYPARVSGRSRKKRKKTKEKESAVTKENDPEFEAETELAGSQEEDEISEFAASNKFSLLLLCD